MRGFFSSLALATVLTIATAVESSFVIEQRSSASSRLTPATISTKLGPKLSTNSSIFAQNDPRWLNATERWQASYQPGFLVVVEPSRESDIPIIVKFANSHGIPFLAVNRSHGSTMTLGRLKNGIEISMAQLTDIKIADDEASAFFGGGVWDGQVIDALWEEGFVTGSCACVGVMGPGLGGGHGRYQGFYGLIIDGLISMNVVLADGSAITVSNTSYLDLWWAMRGAGHNFGIVTSFHAEIHKRTVDEWYISEFFFTQDQLESVFEVLNSQQQNGGQPKDLMNYGVFTWNSEFSTTKPIMEFFIHYVSTAEEATPYLKPFQDLKPLYTSGEYYAYPDVLDATGTGMNSPMCQDGHTNMQFPFGLLEHNITATRQIYDYYREITTSQPLYNQSIVVFGAYSLDGVKAVDPDSTAFLHRDDNILCDVLVTYDPDSSLEAQAIAIGKHITQLWADGQPHQKQHISVNYAFGDEPLEQMYGDEPWRLNKLRATKAKYDPHNAFRFYNPII